MVVRLGVVVRSGSLRRRCCLGFHRDRDLRLWEVIGHLLVPQVPLQVQQVQLVWGLRLLPLHMEGGHLSGRLAWISAWKSSSVDEADKP